MHNHKKWTCNTEPTPEGGLWKNCICIHKPTLNWMYVFTYQTVSYIHKILVWVTYAGYMHLHNKRLDTYIHYCFNHIHRMYVFTYQMETHIHMILIWLTHIDGMEYIYNYWHESISWVYVKTVYVIHKTSLYWMYVFTYQTAI